MPAVPGRGSAAGADRRGTAGAPPAPRRGSCNSRPAAVRCPERRSSTPQRQEGVRRGQGGRGQCYCRRPRGRVGAGRGRPRFSPRKLKHSNFLYLRHQSSLSFSFSFSSCHSYLGHSIRGTSACVVVSPAAPSRSTWTAPLC